jgi:hypothetical protein
VTPRIKQEHSNTAGIFWLSLVNIIWAVSRYCHDTVTGMLWWTGGTRVGEARVVTTVRRATHDKVIIKTRTTSPGSGPAYLPSYTAIKKFACWLSRPQGHTSGTWRRNNTSYELVKRLYLILADYVVTAQTRQWLREISASDGDKCEHKERCIV